MIVTDIIPIDKKRDKIYIDNEFAFVIYKGESHLYSVKAGEEISKEDYEKIMYELLPKRAKIRAMNLLTKRDYTELGMRQKLLEGYYNDTQINETIEYLKQYGYIDDGRYVRNYFSVYIQTKPKSKIIQKLIEKGISLELIESLVDEIYELERTLTHLPDEMEIGRKLLNKKKYNMCNSVNERQKAFRYLIRHGISNENAINLLKEYQKEHSFT